MLDSVAQILGFFAVASFLFSYLQKQRRHIILCNVASRVLYIIQYLLLGAYSGAALDVMGACSSVLAERKHLPQIKKHEKLWFYSINALMIAVGSWIAWFRGSVWDLLPVAGVLLHTGAFWISDERVIRRISFLGSPFWLAYNLLSRAYGSAVGDLLTMLSILLAMLRYGDFQKKTKK